MAWLKPGTAQKYVGEVEGLTGKKLTIKRLVFSPHTGKRVVIPLTGAKSFDLLSKLAAEY